ncbi:MAG: hypothetical protein IJC73_06175 [Lentisphaeria bacterium]|nr:hypothetical protein [Lentisphaeria bacterium]
MKIPDVAATVAGICRRVCAAGWPVAGAIVALAALPLFRPDWYLTADADVFSAWYEAVRRTLLENGEFPFWNPWSHGGVPLFANPQVAVLGLETLTTILTGAWMGWRAAAFGYLLAGAVGMYLLTGDWVRETAARVWGAVLFAANGAWALHLAMGHPVFCGLLLLPYLIWLIRRMDRDWRYAAGAGAVLGMMFNHSLHYGSLMAGLTAAAVGGMVWWRNRRQWRFIGAVCVAAAGMLAVGGYRLVVTLDYLRHFPRETDLRMTVTVPALLRALMEPFVPAGTEAFMAPRGDIWHWHELGCYTGVLAIFFFFFSLRRGVRSWHWGAVAAILLMMDSASPWMPGYYFRQCWPFTSFLMITRWRLLLIFCLAIGAAAGLDGWTMKKRWKWLIVAVSSLMLTANFWRTCLFEPMPRGSEAQVMQVFEGLPPQPEIRTVNLGDASAYVLVARNYAEINAYEPQLGYVHDFLPARRPVGHPEYRGECFAIAGDAVWHRRTPNRIAFAVTSPEAVIGINQNPGSYWRDRGGERLFLAGFREFEDTLPFELTAPAGDYELLLRPPLHEAGLAVSLAGWIGLAAALLVERHGKKSKKTQQSHSQKGKDHER